MKHSLSRKAILLLIIFFHFGVSLKAQNVTNENLFGCWKIKSIYFFQPMADSLAMKNQLTDMITCFEKGGKFTTKKGSNNNVTVIGTGTFNMRPDGRTPRSNK